MDKEKMILEKTKELARETKNWADLSNSIFDPIDGEIVKMFPTPEERQNFRKTEEYAEIRGIVREKMHETGVAEGATPTKSGKFVVRLPRSLHAALEQEAERESTSLNQLIVTKLAVQLDNLAGGRVSNIIQAFGEVREGYSVDRVIADPQFDKKFLRRCRELGLSGTDYSLNWELMSERKKGGLSNLPKTKKYTVRETDEFEYASELAVRFLEMSKHVSLDQVICDPDLASEFDEYATRLAPGFSPLEYRWVALGLRKAGRLAESKLNLEEIPKLELLGNVNTLRLQTIPKNAGLYLFSSSEKPVFMSQTDNLVHRLQRHMEVSSSRGLPNWLWDTRKEPLQIAIAPLPDASRTLRQKFELELIKELKPVLNFQRKVA